MNSKVIALCSLVILPVVLSGCGPKRTAYNQKRFIIETSRSIPQQEISKDITLDVTNLSINTTFSTKSLVYRKSRSEYETDFYNQFLVNPEDMITEKTRSWLSRSGLFKLVLKPGSFTDPTHVLEGNITALYGDFRDDTSASAAMEIRVFLVKLPQRTVVFTSNYEAVSEFKDQTAESLIEAFGLCLTDILSNLEKDLQKQL